MGTGGQSGGGGGGGIAAIEGALEQGTQDIPVDELYANTTVAKRAKPVVEDAWRAMDDDDRRFVIDALKGGDIGYMEGRNRPDGEARFQGKRFRDGTVEWESTGKIRLHNRTRESGSGARAAGTLMHEARHIDTSGGKAMGPNRRWSQQERAATGKQLEFHEKHVVRANDPMLTRFRDVGFAGNAKTGKFMWEESARPMMSLTKRMNYHREERTHAKLEGMEVK